MNYKTLEKQIINLETGKELYVNAINLSMNGIDSLKKFVKNGTLILSQKELDSCIKKECQENYINGIFIAPQMVYVKA